MKSRRGSVKSQATRIDLDATDAVSRRRLRRLPPDVALLVTVVIWGLNFTVVKVGLGAIEPLAFSVVRFALGGSVTVILLVGSQGKPRFRRRDLPLLGAAAILGITVNQAAFVGAVHLTSASNVALIVGTIPIWTSVFAVAARQENLDMSHWIALGAGLVGITLVVLGGPQTGVGSHDFSGEVLALLVAASWGAYSVLIRPLMARYSASQLSAFMMVAGTIALLPFAIPELVSQDWAHVPLDAWLALVYAAILSVTVTNILYFTAIAQVGASRAAIYAYLEPFLGVLFAALLLSERITTLQLAGGVVIVLAVVAGRLRPSVLAEPGL